MHNTINNTVVIKGYCTERGLRNKTEHLLKQHCQVAARMSNLIDANCSAEVANVRYSGF